MSNELVQQAIKIVGSQSALAKRCGKKQGHVWHWLNSERVSAEAAILIDAATEGVVPKHALRPDLFPPPSSTATVHHHGASAPDAGA